MWANAGITQFHLPEAPTAQIFDGIITIAYKSEADLAKVQQKFMKLPEILINSKCQSNIISSKEMLVTDPWGSLFSLIVDEMAHDNRGTQASETSLPLAITDLCFNVPKDASLDGIGRFYNQILGAPILPPTNNNQTNQHNSNEIKIITSPQQTLTFRRSLDNRKIDHSDVKIDDEGIANYGPHISLYLYDYISTYKKIENMNSIFINHRFKRRAYNLGEAIDQCMFRCLDIIDPLNVSNGRIIRLEHEIRSIVTKEGTKYKSCPFFEIPTTTKFDT